MRVKGLDNGYLDTKDDEGRIFKSAISKDSTDILNKNTIIVNGISYTVGAGEKTQDTKKANNEVTIVSSLMNLALTGEDDYFIVAGLPISQFKEQKEDLRIALMDLNKSEVIYKNKRFNFTIKDVTVFPQGVGALFSLNNLNDGEFILIDIGGLTIDVAYVEIRNGSSMLKKYYTWYNGVQNIYPSIIGEVNRQFNLIHEPEYAETIFRYGLQVDGERKDLKFLEEIKRDYIKGTLNELNRSYPMRTTPIYLAGGGAMIYKDVFMKEYKNITLIDNPQFANAIGYQKVGLTKYKKYINIPLSNNRLYRG